MAGNADYAAQTGSDLEWDRLLSFLRSPTGPLALIEVESAAHADQVVSTITRTDGVGRVLVFRLEDGAEPRRVIDWLSEEHQDADPATLFLVLGLDGFATDEPQARQFWTWMNFQRERCRPARGKLAFVLTPRHVNCLARHADALWDWIPLKFNLLRTAPGEHATLESRHMMQLGRAGRDPGAAAKLLPALRAQLAEARRQGLPEAIVRRDYAWPLLRTLCDAEYLAEARRVLERDLFGDVAPDLDPAQRSDWWRTVGYLHLALWDLGAAENAFGELIGQPRSERDLAVGHYGMGRVAEERRDFAAAEQWYRKSLAISEKLGNEPGAAITYHQLGRIAEEQRDFAAAEQWYRKSLAIKEKLGDEPGAATTYHQLGIIAQEQGDFAAAEQWYRKSLAISEKLGNEPDAATTYHELGRIAAKWRDFGAAEQWYRKSLAIEEKLGNEHGAAMTYGQLGVLAVLQEQFHEAGRWFIKSALTFARCNDPHGAQQTAGNFLVVLKLAPADVQAKLTAMWQEAGLGELPKDSG